MNPLFGTVKRPNRSDYGIEEQILEMLFRLNDKKSSQLFKQPVSITDAPDYYSKIKEPMDLLTIETRLKQGGYYYADHVLQDLNLIISNCMQYNSLNQGIKKNAEKFKQCINTEWQNFVKEIQRKGIDYNTQLNITQDLLQKLVGMEERRKKRKTANTLNLLPTEKRFGENDYEFYASLSSQTFKEYPQQKKNQDQFEGFQMKVDDYATFTQQQRKKRLLIVLNEQEISHQFKQMSKKKLDKYRGILNTKINWFRDKILKKTMNSKKFANLLVPAHLDKNIQNQDIAKALNIRKLQLFVKQIAYFIQAFQHILTDSMKQKFLTNCRAIRSCLSQIIKYKRISAKSTKIKLENPFIEIKQDQNQEMIIPDAEFPPNNDKDQVKSNMSEETKGYQQKMKEFRRLLDRDKKDHTRKDTKVRLNRETSGTITSSIVYQDNQKKKPFYGKKFTKDSSKFDLPKDDQEKRREQQLNEERNRDRIFISEYNKRSNVQIIRKYAQKIQINWEKGVEAKQPIQAPIQFFISKG